MNFINIIILNTYSIILLVIAVFHVRKLVDIHNLQDRLHLRMLVVSIYLLVLDIISRFDGESCFFFPFLNRLGNFLIFSSNCILPSLWLAYVHIQVFGNKEKTKRLLKYLSAFNILNLILVIISQFTGWLYYIDSDNIYHRGPLFIYISCVIIAFIIASVLIVIKNGRNLDKKCFYYLIFFPLPPLICILLQIKYYGLSAVLNGVVISLLILLLNIQNKNIHTDYLTGVNNRKLLDAFLAKKIAASSRKRSFSAILIDLNNFKVINDTYGHETGDDALKKAVDLLKGCVRSNDFIARYGGDEFFLVLDISNQKDLDSMVARIKNCFESFNNSDEQEYKLGLSMGYAVYDVKSGMSSAEFQKHIDMLMYKNKSSIKKQKTNKMV